MTMNDIGRPSAKRKNADIGPANVAQNFDGLAELQRERHRLAAELKGVEAAIAAADAQRDARARERAMTTAVARQCVFRDGTPKTMPGHREIARRYAWSAYKAGKSLPRPVKGQIGRSKLITLIRNREVERICSARYGGTLPDDPAGRDLIMIVAHHIAHIGSDASRHILAWISVWAPWMPQDQAAALVAGVIARPLKFKADTLGWRLRLSAAERTALAITTIGAFDLTKAERERARKLRRAAAERKRRRKKGAMPRDHYTAASLAKARPWDEAGMSRSSWYRRGKPAGSPWEAQSSQCEDMGALPSPVSRKNGFETSPRPAGDSDYADRIPVSNRALRAGVASSHIARRSAVSSRAQSRREEQPPSLPPAHAPISVALCEPCSGRLRSLPRRTNAKYPTDHSWQFANSDF